MQYRKLVLVAAQVVLPNEDLPVSALIEVDIDSGKITRVERGGRDPGGSSPSTMVMRIPDHHILLPGLVDTHVHLNQPGRTPWEGFQTGTAAAVSGGVTTLVDMPLNSIPPTTNVPNLACKHREASKVGTHCDLGFWGGVIPGNSDDLLPLLDAGVKGFKCFLISSGVEEFPHVTEADLIQACDAISRRPGGGLILFHAELERHQHTVVSSNPSNPSSYSTFLNSRPPRLELDALDLILQFARQYPSIRFHIVHLSAAEAVPRIRAARLAGVENLTVETCFHYLVLKAEDIPFDATQYKCCPPIRPEANRRQICQALREGVIDYVVSDHSPCIPELKRGDFMSAWGGVSGLGLGLSLMWTEFRNDVPIARISHWLSTRQAVQVGLGDRKGLIAEGYDGDFAIFDPEKAFLVSESDLQFKNKISPYIGKRLQGQVTMTILRGQCVWDGALVRPNLGRIL